MFEADRYCNSGLSYVYNLSQFRIFFNTYPRKDTEDVERNVTIQRITNALNHAELRTPLRSYGPET